MTEASMNKLSTKDRARIIAALVEGNSIRATCQITSFVELQILTMRMSMRRMTRLTNVFSKKVENQAHAVALHFMHYSFAEFIRRCA